MDNQEEINLKRNAKILAKLVKHLVLDSPSGRLNFKKYFDQAKSLPESLADLLGPELLNLIKDIPTRKEAAPTTPNTKPLSKIKREVNSFPENFDEKEWLKFLKLKW
jgi:hypothetical protein